MLKNIKQIISYILFMACIIVITVTTVKIVEMIWPLENAKTLLVIVVVFLTTLICTQVAKKYGLFTR
ncbi:hypothetical protein AVL56_14690 [Alteromonas stellipolaris]|jgi:hypothetical protein|uniref:Uncharacterized protein n=1 Tax=Alteromonas stellipolaris TaxID=233316 RepID=A0ABN4LMK6_9ALTE|nr:hypothetical protein [Alteromonas stellipolaris]ALM89608.1 hypothetical protein AOR13_556 [Alteromonas stellipolaris LMG 21856]AMJ87701.1 hypothetical protein AV939_14640 [Alteromonas sp. Mac1]AMJ91565.1 hypothetical protein AV940_14390 [Alteromonas sp. Mac2]AMJ75288.1 hypothetical protein AVL57_15735 [Alteromonas stellipolaris]AMJ95425.1 hypothetical protein AVL56_14690 [Alteromonas stellipolaris]